MAVNRFGAVLWLRIPRVAKKNKEGDKNNATNAILPCNNCNVTDAAVAPFDKLFNCWGAGLSCDETAHAEVQRQEARQIEAFQAEMKRLEKEREAAIVRKKDKEVAIAEKAAATAKAQEYHDLAKEAAHAKMEQEEQAKEAANARHEQAMIQAHQAKEASEIKLREVAEARRQVKKAKEEAKAAKKVAAKEAKKAKQTQKEAQVIAKKTKTARQKYDKNEAAAKKRMAKEEAKKAAQTRKLIQQMEKEEVQIRDAEDNIMGLRENIKAVAASGHLSSILDQADSDTESDSSTIFSLDTEGDEDLANVLTDILEEASSFLQGE